MNPDVILFMFPELLLGEGWSGCSPLPQMPLPHPPPACVSDPGYAAEAYTASPSLRLTYALRRAHPWFI